MTLEKPADGTNGLAHDSGTLAGHETLEDLLQVH